MGISLAKTIFVAGLLIAALGGLMWLGQAVPWIRLGRLPGDIRIDREGFTFYFPLTTMLLLSVIATGLMWLLRR